MLLIRIGSVREQEFHKVKVGTMYTSAGKHQGRDFGTFYRKVDICPSLDQLHCNDGLVLIEFVLRGILRGHETKAAVRSIRRDGIHIDASLDQYEHASFFICAGCLSSTRGPSSFVITANKQCIS